MTQQYRINTTNMLPADPDDCYLEPTDPIHALKASTIMGGLGGAARLAEYNEYTQQERSSAYFKRRAEAQAQGIRPGTPAWYALFSK